MFGNLYSKKLICKYLVPNCIRFWNWSFKF